MKVVKTAITDRIFDIYLYDLNSPIDNETRLVFEPVDIQAFEIYTLGFLGSEFLKG